ncbi:thioredoxin family protein [Prevotella cerevisiae]|uniref:Thioredoxin family protein n=1 Tax=Segatella cerevisiae TaxID=2053716 RepID=A0ABT1BYM8_9BACT|nr:thioredoxin family protein [Segatella cerevisiae]MCO6025790.1 thioredoxin family protein [Segatella cerevisiae]
MKKAISLLVLCMAFLMAHAQMVDPVHFSSQVKMNGTADAEIIFTGRIDAGWHVYSTDLGNNGPISATFHANKMKGVKLVGKLMPRGHEISKMDPIFGMRLRYFEGSVTFIQKVKFTAPAYQIDAYLEYGACNDQNCLPPTQVEVRKSGKSPSFDAAASQTAAATGATGTNTTVLPTAVTGDSTALPAAADSVKAATAAPAAVVQATPQEEHSWWQPVISQLQSFGGNGNIAGHSLFYIFWMGFIGGLLALMMPCIWPIIPMTISFFLKRGGSKRRGIRDASLYGLSIIVIFLALGILITAIFGPSTLNSLATNAVFNVILFLLLVLFAFSFFGWFEIKLPDSWGNAVDSKAANTTGLISIFLMAFALVLISFSCTAPIIGLLLVQTVTSGNWAGPAIGMFGFSLALAIPFTLFAMFPSWLKSAPKSGSWMNNIKVVLGFIELAFSLKFLSVADLAYGWHLLSRETFLALWIVIFGAMGMYLIGKLRFQSDALYDADGKLLPAKPMPVAAVMIGLCSLAFAIYMVPGLWGAPCKAVSAFAPPINTQDFNLNDKVVKAQYTDYEQGMAAAKSQGKPVLIDFTGFGCVNCRKMEAAVWTDPSVADKLTKDYVLISLFVDDKTPLPKPIEVNDNGRTRTLRTIGDRWSYLQAHKFGSNTQPFYVPVDNNGKPLNRAYSYKEDVAAYLDFLNKGLANYAKETK